MRVRDDVTTEFFLDFDLFDGFEAAEIDALAEFTEYRVYEPGEHVVDEGDRSRDIFLLTDGRIEIRKADREGEAKNLATLEPEAILGELGLVLGEPRSATAVAETEAHLLHIAGEPLLSRRRDGLIAAHKIEHNVLRSLARRQSDMNARLMEAMGRLEESSAPARDEVTELRENLTENWSF